MLFLETKIRENCLQLQIQNLFGEVKLIGTS